MHFFRYEFRHRVALGYEGELRLTSRIRNIRPDGKPFSFTFAYHPYLFVSDIRFGVFKDFAVSVFVEMLHTS